MFEKRVGDIRGVLQEGVELDGGGDIGGFKVGVVFGNFVIFVLL